MYVRTVNSIWFQKVIHVNIMTLLICICIVFVLNLRKHYLFAYVQKRNLTFKKMVMWIQLVKLVVYV